MQLKSRFRAPRALLFGALFFSLFAQPALAGPPFQTDDPGTTPYHFFDVYLASDYTRTFDSVDGTLPHVDINYGLLPNANITVTLPLTDAQASRAPMHFGYGDTALAAKVCLLQETATLPQISFAPAVVVPTGKSELGLGAGNERAFFPLWAQKGFGRYTFFGGGGLWHNRGEGNRDYTVGGFAVARDMGRGLTLGAEIFGQTADTIGASGSTGFSLGTIKQIDAGHKILFSFGRSIRGTSSFSSYAGYELLFGTHARTNASDENVKS
jgi:hypothetical protein